MDKEKLEQWLTMEDDQKRKYNGYNGFEAGLLLTDGTAFDSHANAKTKRKAIRGKMRCRLKK